MNEHEHRLLEQEIKAQTWPVFQRMVHELQKKEHPKAIPLAAPDGGADTLIPAEADEPKQVVQAKHYPSRINWTECRKSLDEALTTHAPGRITFAFALDFTKNHERSFREKLVEPFPQLKIEPWTLTDIISALNKHSDVRTRYFGRELHEGNVESILRAVKHGGKLDTGADLIEHARSLAEFADEHDRDFEYAVTGTGATMREPKWDDLPFITMTMGDEKTTVRVDAWTREGAHVPLPGFSFTNDEAGREAKEYAREELASGRDAVLRSGARIQVMNPPKVLRETVDGDTIESDEITICVSDPTPVEIEIQTETETIVRTFGVRWIPPREDGHVAFACIERGTFMELDFQALEEPTVSFRFNLSAMFREDVAANLEAARLLHAFFTQERIILRAEQFFPNGELESEVVTGTDADRESVAARVEIYGALALIEERTGVDFIIPSSITQEDLLTIGGIVKVLETGQGTATFHNATAVVEANQIAALGDNSRGDRILRQPVMYELFGQAVNLGMGEYEIPPVRVIDVKPLGMKPDSPAHVTIGPEGTDQMPFRLIDFVEAA
jgi:hypothetical protein